MDIKDPIKRMDALAKARGETKYLSDYRFEGALYSRMLRSSIPRGRIVDIKLPALPEGYRLITYKDIPGKNALQMITADWPCFAETDVKFVGETIGLLVGPDRELLQKLFDQIEVEYEAQEPAITIAEGLACKGGAFLNGNNVHCSLSLQKGEDIEAVFSRAYRIVEQEITTGFQEHVYLETNAAVCTKEDGRFVIYASAQCPFYIRKSVCGLLGLKPDDIIVRQTATGGAFGGKEHFPDVLCGPLLVACYVTGKPVRLVFGREEDIANSVKRHPSRVRFKTALDKDGNILGMDSEVVYNVGAYLASSFVVLQRGCFHVTGCYSFPSERTKGIGVATNTYPSCAFRGFGAPQTLFAIETHMNYLASLLGKDPLEFKRRYLIKKGELTITSGPIIEDVKLVQMLEQVLKASGYAEKSKAYAIGSGKGIGLAFYNHGGAFTGNGESAIIKAHVKLVKHLGGPVEILCGQTEMGQGFQTALRKIAAQVLEIPPETVIYDNPDTSRVPDSGPTAASRSTMVVGNLVYKAALDMKRRIDAGEDGFEVETVYEHPEGYPWDQSTFQGVAYLGYGWGVCAVEVEIDKRTAEPVVKGIWTSHDVGHPIDELICHGQVNGGVVQGIGWASTELLQNIGGHFKQTSLSDYIIPTSMDTPTMSVEYVDNPYPWGPFGAKGMGELTFNGSAAAYVDAVSRAIGKTINAIPIPSEVIMDYMLDKEASR